MENRDTPEITEASAEEIATEADVSVEEIATEADVSAEEIATEADVSAEAEGTSEEMQDGPIENPVNEACESEAASEGENLSAAIEDLGKKVEEMNQLFLQKIMHTTHEEKIVDQMHAELQKYKNDMYSRLIRPLLLDLIAIRDDVNKDARFYAEKGGEQPAIPLDVFLTYKVELQDVLDKYDVTVYESKEGDTFSPLKQRALKKVPTPLEELHGKVARSLSSGYEYKGKAMSPEKVEVYIYQKPEETEGENENG